ncbi:Uridine-cytidine kinase-like 1 [Armadillidium nasatum]|uniref:uridine/cytidine kinase n=1 Tax=Armadillidium nasatum TaxID=96803 RepID=A0A5N5SNI4_9CRUS|nr:Uridine-cytidine kinase-like 1 [Armadillidium nasatum]
MSGKFNLDPPSSASSDSGDEVLERPASEMMVKEDDDNAFISQTESLEDPGSPLQNPKSTGGASQLSGGGPVRSPRMRRQRTSSQSTSSKSREPILRGLRRTIYTAGRPPWYDCQGQLVEPFVIGICGGSASGKTTVARKIIEELDVPWVTLLSLDSFYKVLSAKQHESAARNEYNFDHPDAFDFELVVKTIKRLKDGKKVDVPIYNFLTHRREVRTKTMYGANVVIFEGILSFYSQDVLKVHADIIVPRGGDNEVAINLIAQNVMTQLQQDVVVDTPQGVPYEGKRIATEAICGASILRAGETMENALCEVLKDVRIGKILIQTNLETGEPELYYLRLPKDIKDYHIFLMDATVATGAAAIMAIRVLLDHEVPEENISLCSLLMTEQGVHNIAYAFPKVKIVTTAVDPSVNEKFYIVPGIGNFGDRYFGTEPSSSDP